MMSSMETLAPEPGENPDRRKKPAHHARDVFHAWMLEGAEYAKPLGMPKRAPVHVDPGRLAAFSDAMDPKWRDFDCFVHFFEDEENYDPKKYSFDDQIPVTISGGTCSIDFSQIRKKLSQYGDLSS